MTAQDSGAAQPAPPAPPAPPDQQWHAPHNPWLIAGVATLATFMEVLDTTIVVVALPHIAGNLGANEIDGAWIVTAYLLANAIVLPLSAWLSSLIGRRNYYLTCVALFTITSFLCGLATSLGMLVVFRLLQGLAGGGLQPSTQAIMIDTFPAHRRGMGMAFYGVVVVSAPVIGPTLGGWIADNFSWRWIFFINIPVGILSLILASKYISDPPYFVRRTGAKRWNVDYIGLSLIVLGLGALQLILSIGDRWNWFESPFIMATAIVGTIAIVAAVIWEWRHDDPIVNLRLLRDRNLGPCVLLFTLFGFGFYGSMILLPMFLQGILGYTATRSGMAVSPGGMVIIAMMPVVGWLVSRMDSRKMVAVGFLILAYSLYLMSHFTLEVDFKTILVTRVVQSFGVSLIFVPITTMAYAFISREMRSGAASLMSFGRNAGSSVGIAFAASMMVRHTQMQQNHLVEHFTPLDPGYSEALRRTTERFAGQSGDWVGALAQARAFFYGILQEQASVLAFGDVYRFLAVSVIVVLPLVFLIKKTTHPS